ncbi:MAG: PQQ-like beta-propeller repeat protein [Bacteroidales bacterium]|nr:PQQ-like beta-propeller repeat protein [Bacteroidales bacterium]MBN2757201.1 PQQ-like beta-propeller repeat protein [Bacteroidales bacterium]
MKIKHITKLFLGAFFLFTASFYACNINSDNTEENKIVEKISIIDSLLNADNIEVISSTFLGNNQRNYYGNEAPSKLNLIWKINLGTGTTKVGSQLKKWSGAGWTGQPLLIKQNSVLYLIQGSYDHRLKKIDAETGKIIWQYEFEDVIKGTGTFIVNPYADSITDRYLILQGSRKGNNRTNSSKVVPSFRAISFINGKDVWQYNSTKTDSYSRDVDASAIIINDTAYIGLENGLFTVFNPNPKKTKLIDGIKQPEVFFQDTMYKKTDKLKHRGNLVTESSPSQLKNRVYVSSGAGHVYGYNILTKKLDWDFFTGADMDGSPVITHDNCLLVSLEKEYIDGKGGVFKLNPSKPADSSVIWYFPVADKFFVFWHGGIIGSVSINDKYKAELDSFYHTSKKAFATKVVPNIAAFTAIDENLYVINTNKIDTEQKVLGPNKKHLYPKPELIFKYKTGPAISTPIILQNRIIAATYNGIYLFEHDEKMNFKLLAHYETGSIEATPVVYNKRIYVASRDGLLYCFGEN